MGVMLILIYLLIIFDKLVRNVEKLVLLYGVGYKFVFECNFMFWKFLEWIFWIFLLLYFVNGVSVLN